MPGFFLHPSDSYPFLISKRTQNGPVFTKVQHPGGFRALQEREGVPPPPRPFPGPQQYGNHRRSFLIPTCVRRGGTPSLPPWAEGGSPPSDIKQVGGWGVLSPPLTTGAGVLVYRLRPGPEGNDPGVKNRRETRCSRTGGLFITYRGRGTLPPGGRGGHPLLKKTWWGRGGYLPPGVLIFSHSLGTTRILGRLRTQNRAVSSHRRWPARGRSGHR